MSDREQPNPLGFEVIDKRGANNPVQERDKTVAETPYDDREVVERRWVSVAYVIALAKAQDGSPMVLGRACGLANDENCFVADYLFGMRWEAGFDWTTDAKRRLDTFLNCTCSPKSGPCAYHRRMAPNGWLKEDHDRIREGGDRIVPKVLEVLSKVEQNRQQAQRILAPRR